MGKALPSPPGGKGASRRLQPTQLLEALIFMSKRLQRAVLSLLTDKPVPPFR